MSNQAEQNYKEFGKTVDKNTRSIIVAKIDHNGDASVNLTGGVLDLSYLSALINTRVSDIITSGDKKKEGSNESTDNKN